MSYLRTADGLDGKGKGARHRDHGLKLAERLLAVGFDYYKLRSADLGSLRKGDARKRVIGHLISRNTTAGLAWIGQQLPMGERTRVSRNCGSLETSKRARQREKDAAAIYEAALNRSAWAREEKISGTGRAFA